MYKNILGVAAIVAATAVLIDSLPRAEAQGLGPVITGGEIPWVSFTGSVERGRTSTVYTVPSDRVFVLTGMECGRFFPSTSSSFAEIEDAKCPTIRQDSTQKVDSSTQPGFGGFLSEGKAHVVFEPETTVVLYASSPFDMYYFMEGYLARP